MWSWGRSRAALGGPPRAPSPSLLLEAQLRALLKELEKLRLAESWGAWGPWAGYCLGEILGSWVPDWMGVVAHLSILGTWGFFFSTLP